MLVYPDKESEFRKHLFLANWLANRPFLVWFAGATPDGSQLPPIDILVSCGGCRFLFRALQFPLLPSQCDSASFVFWILNYEIRLRSATELLSARESLHSNSYEIAVAAILQFSTLLSFDM